MASDPVWGADIGQGLAYKARGLGWGREWDDVKTMLLRLTARVYLGIYDLAMRLGPKWGAVTLGYGPVVIAVCAFLLKSRLIDPWIDPGLATVGLFVLFGLAGPLMHVGTRIVTENMHRSRQGLWPASVDSRFDRHGPISPTMHWVGMLKLWSRESV